MRDNAGPTSVFALLDFRFHRESTMLLRVLVRARETLLEELLRSVVVLLVFWRVRAVGKKLRSKSSLSSAMRSLMMLSLPSTVREFFVSGWSIVVCEEFWLAFFGELAAAVGGDVVDVDFHAFPCSAFGVALGVDADRALELRSRQ